MPGLLLALLLTGLAAASAAAGDRNPLERWTLSHDGVEREYFVHVPANSGGTHPVVVAVHGYTSTATGFAYAHGLLQHADANGYLLVLPQGSHFLAGEGQDAWRVTSWNDLAANQPPRDAGPHCAADHTRYPRPPECAEFNRCAWTSCYDDLGFIDRVLDEVEARYATDTGRYYLLGVSNGAMMALRAGCDRSERYAAVASIIGQLAPGYDCGPTSNLPMLHLFGGADDTVRYDGTAAGDGYIYTSAAQTAATWAQALACSVGPVNWQNELSDAAGFRCTAYRNCRVAGQEVVSCLDPTAGHEWPQQGYAGISATCVTAEQYRSMPGQPHCAAADSAYRHLGMDLIWGFFSRYGLSAAAPAE